MRTRTTPPIDPAATNTKLPLAALTAMATASFITVLTEALPGGLLPSMSGDLRVTESAMGQAVTIYAIGSAVAAIPLSAATAGWRRKRLLLTTMAGFAVANTLTAISDQYLLTMIGRFIAGVCGGLVWAMMAGYARRMVPSSLHGKAIAVAMAGTPLSLALGVPAGTLLGQTLGWRTAFLIMTGIALAVLATLAGSQPVIYIAAALWGLGFGGMATLLQTALGHAAGPAADTAQAILVTLWNTALALGGIIGGLLLDGLGAGSFPWSVLVILVPVLATVVIAKHGFPTKPKADHYSGA